MPDNGKQRQLSRGVAFDSLPVTVSDRAFRTVVGILGMLLGLVLLTAAVAPLLIDPPKSVKGTIFFVLVAGGLGAAICVGAFGYLSRSVCLTITKDSVTLATRACSKRQQWSEPLANYEGVLLETEMRGKYLVWNIWLQHSKEAKRVLLRREPSERKAREFHEHFCRVLGLPALESTSDGIVRREVEELGRPLRQLYREHEGEAAPDAATPAPPALKILDTPRETEVTLLARMPLWEALISVGLAGILWMLLALGLWVGRLFGFAILAAAAAALAVLTWVWEVISYPKLRFTDEAVELVRELPLGEWRVKRILHDEIVAVTITKRPDQAFEAVVLRSARAQIRFGSRLAPDELQWLKNFVLRYVARPTRASG